MQNFKPFTLFTYIYILYKYIEKSSEGRGGTFFPNRVPSFHRNTTITEQYSTHTHPPPAPHFAELVIHQSNRVDMYISYFFAASKNEKNFLGIKCALPIL